MQYFNLGIQIKTGWLHPQELNQLDQHRKIINQFSISIVINFLYKTENSACNS